MSQEAHNEHEARFNSIEDDVKSIKDEFSKLSEFLQLIAEQQKENVEEKSHKFYNNAKQRATQIWDELSDEDVEVRQYVGDKLQKSSQKLVDKTRENPLTTVVTAAGIGLLIGFLLKK